MKAKNDLKKQLTLKGNSVKRTVKEYQYYIKDLEKEQNKLKKMEEEGGKSEGDLTRQKDIVSECEGAKKQTFASVEKFYKELNDLLTEIDTHNDDEQVQKERDDAKELPEYIKAKDYLQSAKELIDQYGAAS